jgi:hypothetical protein
MEYFPRLNLDHLQLQVTFTVFGILSLLFIAACFFLIKKKKYNSLMILAFAMIAIIPSCCLVDATVGKVVFKELHLKQNKHMPEPAECILYEPEFASLIAKYRVSPEALKKWIVKYKLKEGPVNKFASKTADQTQNLKAAYDPKSRILTIRYSPF